MAEQVSTDKAYEDYLKSLGNSLKGVDDVVMYEDFVPRLGQGQLEGVVLCLHRPQWRGDDLRGGSPKRQYQGGFTLMKALLKQEDSEELSDAINELSVLGQELVAKMIYDSMQRTQMVGGRIQKLTPVFAYVGDDVRAEPVQPEGINTAAGVHVDFAFSVYANMSVNQDLWQ